METLLPWLWSNSQRPEEESVAVCHISFYFYVVSLRLLVSFNAEWIVHFIVFPHKRTTSTTVLSSCRNHKKYSSTRQAEAFMLIIPHGNNSGEHRYECYYVKHLTPPISFGQSCQYSRFFLCLSHIYDESPTPFPFLLQIFHHLKSPQLFMSNQINMFVQLCQVGLSFIKRGLVTRCIHNIMFNPFIAPTWQHNLMVAWCAQATWVDTETAESGREKNGGKGAAKKIKCCECICKCMYKTAGWSLFEHIKLSLNNAHIQCL